MTDNPTVVFVERKRVEIEDCPVRDPGPGEMLVRNRRTLISTGTELSVLIGEFPDNSAWARYGKLPFVAGYCAVGEVVAIGQGVEDEWVGRRVGTYLPHQRYGIVRAENAQPIRRDEVSDEEAPFYVLAEIAQQGVRRGQVTWGESAILYGLGLIGQLAARVCRIAGARPVFCVDLSDGRLGLLPDAPTVVPLNPDRDSVVEVVRERTRERMADVVFEVTGAPNLIPREFEAVRRMGRMVILSSPRGETAFDFHDLCNSPSYTIIGAHNGSHTPVATPGDPWTKARDNELFFDWLAEGDIEVKSLISHRAPWTDAPRMYEMLLADRSRAMGVVLEWE